MNTTPKYQVTFDFSNSREEKIYSAASYSEADRLASDYIQYRRHKGDIGNIVVYIICAL